MKFQISNLYILYHKIIINLLQMLSIITFFNLALVLIAMFTNSFVFNLIDKIQGTPIIGNEGRIVVINKTNDQIIQKNHTEGFWNFPIMMCDVWNQYRNDFYNYTIRVNYESMYEYSRCDYYSNNMNILKSYGSMLNFRWIYIAFSIGIFLITCMLDFNIVNPHIYMRNKSVLGIVTIFYSIALCLSLYNIGNIMNNLMHDLYTYDNPFKENILNFYACILLGLFCNTILFIILIYLKSFK